MRVSEEAWDQNVGVDASLTEGLEGEGERPVRR